jgi:multicomponent Na+:H+ antiporter subunit B
MVMTKRNESLIQLGALLLIIALGIIVFFALTDKREGVTINSTSLDQRVSYKYLNKSVKEDTGIPVTAGWKGYENGSANIVTSIVVDYRIFDTFGEILVLFASAAGVGLLMTQRKKKIEREASLMVKTAIPYIMVFILVVGFYIIIHGHLTPGGGFPGGAIITSAFILQFLAFNKKPNKKGFKFLESFAGLGLLGMGIAGLVLKGSFFGNFLPTGIVGNTISAIGIMILYILVGIKVASELSAISSDFIGE